MTSLGIQNNQCFDISSITFLSKEDFQKNVIDSLTKWHIE